MGAKMSVDPNKLFTTMVDVFVVVGHSREEARKVAGMFWKKIYADAVLVMAEDKPEMDKDKLRELVDKGVMAELLIAALEHVSNEELGVQIQSIARSYSRILWEEMNLSLAPEKMEKIKELWKRFGEEEGLDVSGKVSQTEKTQVDAPEAKREGLPMGDDGLIESGDTPKEVVKPVADEKKAITTPPVESSQPAGVSGHSGEYLAKVMEQIDDLGSDKVSDVQVEEARDTMGEIKNEEVQE